MGRLPERNGGASTPPTPPLRGSRSSQSSRPAGPSGSVLAEGERHVVSAETERVADGVFVVARTGFARDDVQVDLGVQILEVQGGWDDAVAQGHHGEDG